MRPIEQQFLNELDKKLWTAADKLRSNLDAAVYKHVVLGLIFLKYVSDSFAERQAEIEAQFRRPGERLLLDPADYDKPANYEAPSPPSWKSATTTSRKTSSGCRRWRGGRPCRTAPSSRPGTEIQVKNGKTTSYKITSTGKLIDDALEAVEKENPTSSRASSTRTTPASRSTRRNLAGLIDLIATIPRSRPRATCTPRTSSATSTNTSSASSPWRRAKRAASTSRPRAIVTLIVEMLEPYQGRVYDPAMGSGGFFVQSEHFIEEHGGNASADIIASTGRNPIPPPGGWPR